MAGGKERRAVLAAKVALAAKRPAGTRRVRSNIISNDSSSNSGGSSQQESAMHVISVGVLAISREIVGQAARSSKEAA